MIPPGMLEGLRVLDLSRIIVGPYCAMLLGDLGAEVVKLERPARAAGRTPRPPAVIGRNSRRRWMINAKY